MTLVCGKKSIAVKNEYVRECEWCACTCVCDSESADVCSMFALRALYPPQSSISLFLFVSDVLLIVIYIHTFIYVLLLYSLSLSLTLSSLPTSHYSLSAFSKLEGSGKEREAECLRVTSLTLSSSNPGFNFTGTLNKQLSHYRMLQ